MFEQTSFEIYKKCGLNYPKLQFLISILTILVVKKNYV